MIFVSEAESGKPPRIFHIGVDGKTIIFHGQRCAMAEHFKSTSEIVGKSSLELFSPARSSGRQSAQSKSDRRHVEAGVETAAAVEADLVGVELVEIVQDAADGKAFVIVELFVENADGNGAGVKHQILADVAAGIGQAIREFIGSGKQEEPRRFRAIRGENDGFRLLQMDVFLFVEIDGAGGAAMFVHFNLVDVTIGTNFAFAGTFGERNHAGQRTRFGFDFTTKGKTEAAIDAGAASRTGLRKNGHGRGKRIPAKFARGTFKDDAGTFYGKRRHGIRL